MKRSDRVARLATAAISALAAAACAGAKGPRPPAPYAGPEPRTPPTAWVDAIPSAVEVAGSRLDAMDEESRRAFDAAARFKLGMGTGDVLDAAREAGLAIGVAEETSSCRGALGDPLCLRVRLPGRQLPPYSIDRLWYDEWPGSIPYDLFLGLDGHRVATMSLRPRTANEYAANRYLVHVRGHYGPPTEAIRGDGAAGPAPAPGGAAPSGAHDALTWWWSRDRHAVLLQYRGREECVVTWGLPGTVARPGLPGAAPPVPPPVAVATTTAAAPPPGFEAFHAPARDRAAAPPDEATLRVACQVELGGPAVPAPWAGRWLSLLRFDDGPARIAAFTPARFADPTTVIWLRARFVPGPAGSPGRAGTLDWGWIYDRNGDGRVDYVVQLRDVLPVARPGAAPDRPRMVFRHAADDDFDGEVDALVLEDLDPVSRSVRGWLAYRAPGGGGAGEAWTFREAIAARDGGGPALLPDALHLRTASERMGIVNAALARCGLGPESLARAP